jgi:tight adherence protein B
MSGLLLFFFLTIFAAILVTVAIGVNVLEAQRQRQFKNVLSTLVAQTEIPDGQAPIILVDPQDRSDPMRTVLTKLNLIGFFESRLAQSGLNWTVSHLVGLMLLTGAVGFFLGWLFNFLVVPWISDVFFAGLFGIMPLLYVVFKKSQRMDEFEQQFPEALDFIARAMRSGHAFSVSLEMLGNETPDPLGREFRALFNEQNLGAPLEVALDNLMGRIPLLDVRFFVSIVRLQRQTGGNLSEILGRLAYVIRERFRLKGQVRAASAHGRLTAGILFVLPLVTMIALRFIAPDYIQSMTKDSDGKYMIAGAVALQIIGFLIMKKIINIKV